MKTSQKRALSDEAQMLCYFAKDSSEISLQKGLKLIRIPGLKKSLFTLCLLLSASNFLFAQAQNDETLVLQKCIELPALQQYYALNTTSANQVNIMQYPVTFSAIVTSSFSTGVAFLSPAQITIANVEQYFSFRRFNISQNLANASIVFFYNYNHITGQFNMITINIDLEKINGVWNVTNSNIGGDTL
jgi:hypothetical protein